jgi:hypothetical protein
VLDYHKNQVSASTSIILNTNDKESFQKVDNSEVIKAREYLKKKAEEWDA